MFNKIVMLCYMIDNIVILVVEYAINVMLTSGPVVFFLNVRYLC